MLAVALHNHAMYLAPQAIARSSKRDEPDSRGRLFNVIQGMSMIIGESHKRKTLIKALFGSNEVVKNY